MKTQTIFITLFVLIAKQSFSQGFYIGAQGGYNSPILAQLMGENYSSTSSGSSTEKVLSNFGSGTNIGILTGYKLKSNISIEIGFTNFFTNPFSSSSNYSYGSSSNSDLNTFNSKLNIVSAGIKYSNTFSFGEPYIRAGLLFGNISFTYNHQNTNISSSSPAQTSEDETNYTGSLAIGGFGAFGIKEKVSPNFSFFVEGIVNLLQFNPARSELTKSTINGIDQLPNRKTYDKITEYGNSYSTNSSSDPNSPRKGIMEGVNFSSIGLQIGLIYDFTNHEISKK